MEATPGDDIKPKVLVISCSDGRFAQAKQQFLTEDLELTVFDEVTVPGGPARVLISGTNFFAVQDDIKMLAKAHATERVIAIAHFDCAYYHNKHPRLEEEADLREKQKNDLLEFAEEIKNLVPNVLVELYRENVEDGQVVFREIKPTTLGGDENGLVDT